MAPIGLVLCAEVLVDPSGLVPLIKFNFFLQIKEFFKHHKTHHVLCDSKFDEVVTESHFNTSIKPEQIL